MSFDCFLRLDHSTSGVNWKKWLIKLPYTRGEIEYDPGSLDMESNIEEILEKPVEELEYNEADKEDMRRYLSGEEGTAVLRSFDSDFPIHRSFDDAMAYVEDNVSEEALGNITSLNLSGEGDHPRTFYMMGVSDESRVFEHEELGEIEAKCPVIMSVQADSRYRDEVYIESHWKSPDEINFEY